MFILKLLTIVGNILSPILRLFGLQNVIILEAEPGTRDNTQAVFLEMLRRGWDARYRFVLASKTPQSLAHWNSKRITVVQRPRDGDNWIVFLRFQMIKLRAVIILDENTQIRKGMSITKHVFLTHGSPLKDTRGYYSCMPDTDYALCQSEYLRPIVSKGSVVPSDRRVILGMPRNDRLFDSEVSMEALFGERYKKVVVWYPTFRQHKVRGSVPGTSGAAIPIIHKAESAQRINEIAAKYDVLLLVKPHPAQDLSTVTALDLDHLKVITDDFFIQHGITSYTFLGKTDALITDYSSVLYDYLLTRKPIALAQEDYEEYEKNIGFVIDMNLLRSCAVNLLTAEDFEPFFRDLVAGNDPLREKRDELMHLTNQYTDGNSAKRVVDWLETLLKK